MLCQYKNIFGQPDKGVHAYRIGPFALVDVLGTILLALLIMWWKTPPCSTKEERLFLFTQWFLILLVLGEFAHLLFCVDTTGIRYLKEIIK
jgi:hypothetical protein